MKERKLIETTFCETLSWEYLSWAKNHPITYHAPTSILYGSMDHLQSLETIKLFAKRNGFDLVIMDGREHYFHIEEQMKFLDNWISRLRIN